jgi:polyribonucleotide nucleotidyltransferase
VPLAHPAHVVAYLDDETMLLSAITAPKQPAYQPDAYEAVEAAASDDLAAALTIAGKQECEAKLDEVKLSVVGSPRAERSLPERTSALEGAA